MTDVRQPAAEQIVDILCTLARLNATHSDLHELINNVLTTCLEALPLTGAVVWLRSNEQDIFTPSGAFLPKGYSVSALSDDSSLIQGVVMRGAAVVDRAEAEALVLIPEEGLAVALVPVQSSEGTLLALLGYIAPRDTLKPLLRLFEASANMLSASVINMWLRRQQADADAVADTLFRFAGELRKQETRGAILSMLGDATLKTFNCDWAAVYSWQEEQEAFVPVHIVTRVGPQPVEEETPLVMADHPILELVFQERHPHSLRDLRSQPGALPIYLDRYALRGVMLVPIQHESTPLALLVSGYRAPMVTLTGRTTALARGLARMVAIALKRTEEHT
jgi:GAF domain-containing protein